MASIALVHVDDVGLRRLTRSLFHRPVFRLEDDLAALGHEVRTIAISHPDTPDRSVLGALDPFRSRLIEPDLSSLFSREGFDVVHGIGEEAGRVLERCMPPQTWAWSSDVGDRGWWPSTARLTVVPTTHDLARLVRSSAPLGGARVIPERLSTLVSFDDRPDLEPEATTAVTALDDVSAVVEAVRALPLLPGLRLTVLADRTGEHRMAARPIDLLARSLGVQRRLRWCRPADASEARRVLAQAGVLLALSRTAVDPAVVVAAMAVGTPVVVAAGGGAECLARLGSSAVVVRKGSPRRLATVLRVVLRDVRTRSDLAEAARRVVRDDLHPWTATTDLVAAYAELFDGVVKPDLTSAHPRAGYRGDRTDRRTVA